jgi:hypothetical protein
MKRERVLLFLFLLAVVLCLTAVATLLASPDEPTVLTIPWWTVDGGGGTSKGGSFGLSGTAGQADAGQMSGGTYTLSGGFWVRRTAAVAAVETPLKVYLPFVTK